MKIIPLPALQDNYIWMFFDEQTKNAWVVDPGEANPVIDAMKHHQLNLSGIFITHHHHDHSGGVLQLLDHYGALPVWGSHRSALSFISDRLKENDTVNCGDISFQAIEIPGHTLDHTAFFGNRWVFSGDTLFSAGCGKIFEGTPDQMYHSLQKIAALPDDTQIFCGHEYTLNNLYFAQHIEPDSTLITEKIKIVKELCDHRHPTLPSNLLEEKRINPFLRCHSVTIRAAVEHYAGESLDSPVNVFAKLREWKNEFKR